MDNKTYYIIISIAGIINLFIIIGILVILYFFFKVQQENTICLTNPSIDCYNNWTCETLCTDKNQIFNQCFYQQKNLDNIAQCLYGVQSKAATLCRADNDNNDNNDNAPLCDCVLEKKDAANNCFNNCPDALDDNKEGTTQNATCCCNDINNPKCGAELVQGKVVPNNSCQYPTN